MKKNNRIITVGLLLLAATLTYCHQKIVINTAARLQTIAQNYLECLHNQECAILQRLNSLGITSTYIERAIKNFEPRPLKVWAHEFSSSKKPVKPEIVKIIHGILQDFDIDPSSMLIVTTDIPSSAALTDHVILVNEERFLKLSSKAQWFVIGHELQHFFHRDDVAIHAVNEYAQRHGINTKHAQCPVNEYSRFFEKRADVLTALKNTDYAQGYLEYTENNFKLVGETPGITHPKNSERLALAQEIKKQIV